MGMLLVCLLWILADDPEIQELLDQSRRNRPEARMDAETAVRKFASDLAKAKAANIDPKSKELKRSVGKIFVYNSQEERDKEVAVFEENLERSKLRLDRIKSGKGLCLPSLSLNTWPGKFCWLERGEIVKVRDSTSCVVDF